MKRSLSLLLALPLLLIGCEGATSSEQATPHRTSPVAASFPTTAPTKRTSSPAERPPSRPQLIDKKGVAKLSMLSAKAKAGAAAVTCDASQYATLTGDQLVFYIQDAGATCINNLYAGNTNTYGAFTKAKMIAIANATAAAAGPYLGTVDSNNLEALYGFLRAGYYVAYYFSANLDWKNTDLEVKAAVQLAIDAFVNNEHFYDSNDAHGPPLREALTLIDSSDSQAKYLYVVRGWLNHWNQTYSTSWYMGSAVNEIFQILYRGHELADFREAIQNDTTLVYALGAFIDQTWMLNSDFEYLMDNAARELARLSQYKRAVIYPAVQEKVKEILAKYQLTDGPYMAVAEQVNFYDTCATYNTCTFSKDLEARILTVSHTCSPTISIRAQSLDTAQLTEACSTLDAEETYFHQKLATNNQPVAGDQNTSLNVIVFASSADYMKYAGPIYGIDTNNGGMYMEGNPEIPGNQANFYCYQAEWVLPAFEIWNLKHEYVHYLDGRFNMKGGFDDYLPNTGNTIWWIEGLGEYISKQDFYPEAAALARTKEFQLSQVFGNNYDSGQDRVYRWGYLAVRFMFEKHQKDVDTILGFFRVGNYPGYQTWLNANLSTYDSEWTGWLDTVQ